MWKILRFESLRGRDSIFSLKWGPERGSDEIMDRFYSAINNEVEDLSSANGILMRLHLTFLPVLVQPFQRVIPRTLKHLRNVVTCEHPPQINLAF